jgi:hypothetical protein
MQAIAKWTVYLDEHGSVGSDRENAVWGYGFCALPSARVSNLEATLRAKFPGGLHLRHVRRNRKADRLRELVEQLPMREFFGGGHVQTTIDYATRTYLRVLAGTGAPASADDRRNLEQLIAEAPIGAGGLVNPHDVLADATSEARLYTIYSHASRFPVLALRRSIPGNGQIVAGHVGQPLAHERQVVQFKGDLESAVAATYEYFAAAGISVTIRFADGNAPSPIFGVADFFAGAARHYHLSAQREGDALGGELYRIVRPIFERLPRVGSQYLADGISYM